MEAHATIKAILSGISYRIKDADGHYPRSYIQETGSIVISFEDALKEGLQEDILDRCAFC